MSTADAAGANEEQVKKMLSRSPLNACLRRWLSCGKGVVCAIKMNWLTSIMATAITWGFAAMSIDDENAEVKFKEGKNWVSSNFTWLYIGTQDVWCAFLIFLTFSRFGKLKLGKAEEKPRYNDFTWFCMLFTCGVAVGLYVFGVAEPLYFYRQPTKWHDWNYDYAVTKTGVENDAMRAQQAIFMAVYHWGIHGWVPYILLALLIGIVSFRWGLPMTIRSCFYPMIGDHALGVVGDFIDAVSISTTTFGVCTSLGLGVTQLARGMQFLKDIGCDREEKCVDAGGKWDITRYGWENCFCPTDSTDPDNIVYGATWGDSTCVTQSTLEDCTIGFLRDGTGSDKFEEALYAIITLVTVVATFSVLTGLDKGIKFLSKVAFSLGCIVLLCAIYADNTWYVLNVMVQTTGYYLQYVIQVGFDCEAFQQLGFEFQPDGAQAYWANRYWGSSGADSAIGRIEAAGFDVSIAGSNDCGEQPNPCNQGVVAISLAAAMYAAQHVNATRSETNLGTQSSKLLETYQMSPMSISRTTALYGEFVTLYGQSNVDAMSGIPCGSGIAIPANETSGAEYNPTLDAYSQQVFAFGAIGDDICDNALSTVECSAFWRSPKGWQAPMWPRCPETVVKDAQNWGTCDAYEYNCAITRTYFGDTNAMFMDWWTIFYWAWWITWAPFVGFFVAIISRGRTVREVIVGGFFAPTLFAIIWFSVFGGLAIKMERVAEVALQVRPNVQFATATCAEHYTPYWKIPWGPISPEAKALAGQGYYMLHCMDKDDQIYYLMQPYKNIAGFLHVVLWLGLVIYFLTSSDSGSMTDDIISASGLKASSIPLWQKVFWCFTEGIVAISLVAGAAGAKDSMQSLQAASIIIGLPFTFLLCMMVPGLYRALKREMGDEDIIQSMRFNTQLFDICELFMPNGGSPATPMKHVTSILTGLLFPGVAVFRAMVCAYPDAKLSAIGYAFAVEVLHLLWFALHIVQVDKDEYAWVIAWLCMTGVILLIALCRGELRRKYNIWGSPLEDLFCVMCMYPMVCAQIQIQAETDGEGMPTYFASADEIEAEMKALADDEPGLPTIKSSDEVEMAKAQASA
jgi:choline-glycine betaine transporter